MLENHAPARPANPRLPVSLVASMAILVALPLVLAAATGTWALAGAPLGLLLGFFLAKGDLCSAAAIGELLVLRETRKLFGLWVAVVTCMVGFSALSALGLVSLCPRPLAWASYLVGGSIFGVGMVLAGGCVSGTLYKSGLGHASSLLALLAIPVGIQLVDFGPLSGIRSRLSSLVIEGPEGAAVTLGTLTGLPYAVLAGLFAIVTLAVGVRAHRRRAPPPGASRRPPPPLLVRLLVKPWRPAAAGIAVGLLALPVWLTSAASGRDFPLCVTYGVEEAPLLVTTSRTHLIWSPSDRLDTPPSDVERESDRKDVYVWLVLFAVCVIPGAHLAARMAGRPRFYPRPPGQLVAAGTGGLLLGIGAGLAGGCMLGNGISGTALMSVGMMMFALSAAVGNLITTRWWVLG